MLAYKVEQRLGTEETMRRREFIALIRASVVSPFPAMAQEPGRTYRLGMLMPFPRDAPVNLRLLEELRQSGFIEGQNLTIDYRDFGPHVDLISKYAAKLVKAQVDVRRLRFSNAVPMRYPSKFKGPIGPS
jgi:putative ABC transport system substrate-binding protein